MRCTMVVLNNIFSIKLTFMHKWFRHKLLWISLNDNVNQKYMNQTLINHVMTFMGNNLVRKESQQIYFLISFMYDDHKHIFNTQKVYKYLINT